MLRRVGIVSALVVIPFHPDYLLPPGHALDEIEKLPLLLSEPLDARLIEQVAEDYQPAEPCRPYKRRQLRCPVIERAQVHVGNYQCSHILSANLLSLCIRQLNITLPAA
jgi:hypothetical protein